MTIVLTFKDPDGVYEGIEEALLVWMDSLDLTEDELAAVVDIRREAIKEGLERWLTDNEYVTIEVDLEYNTASVKERK